MKETKGEKTFRIANAALLVIICAMTLYPLLYILSASISSSNAYLKGEVLLFPKDITFSAYQKILSDASIWTAYANTIFYTVFGTGLSVILTMLGAYPLSKGYLPGAKTIMKFLVFTMWFQPGMIPLYLTIKSYGLLDTRMGIVVAFALTSFNVILLKNFFESIPTALEEAAKIDGANDCYILFKIFMPLALPSIATIALFYGITRWNGYFWSMILLQSDSKIPLQVLLKKLIIEASAKNEYATINLNQKYCSETIIYATIVISTLPIVAVYPYIQKYFVKGVMIGAVKE